MYQDPSNLWRHGGVKVDCSQTGLLNKDPMSNLSF